MPAISRPAMVSGLPYPTPSSPAVTAVMQANRSTGSKPEVALRSMLHRQGLRFRKNLRLRAGDVAVRPDIVFTAKRVVVFVDGCFWHCCPEHGRKPKANGAYWHPKLERNVARDRRVTLALEAHGWHVVRVWEHESSEQAAERVLRLLDGAT